MALLAASAAPAGAQDNNGRHQLFQKLHLATGSVTLDGLATVTVGPGFAYHNPSDAEIF